jgi:hypothetical protein
MLHHVGDIGLGPVNARLLQSPIEQSPCRSYKRPSLDILFVAGLLANKENARAPTTFAEDGLSGILPQVTCLAVG